MLAAYTGTILPDDGLSGGSLSVITGVLLSVPVIGTHLVFLIFGGAPPGNEIIGRDYWVHILVLPVLAGALLLSLRPSQRWRSRVRQAPLLLFTGAVAAPAWRDRADQPGVADRAVSAGSHQFKARHRTGTWASSTARCGSCRPWEPSIAGHPLALGVLLPGLVVPALFFTGLASIPSRTGGSSPGGHRAGCCRPSRADPANRTAAGVAGVAFYGLLWAASANDQIAYHLQVPLYTVTWMFRVLVLAWPALAFLLTRVFCHALADRRRDEELHGRETGRIVMDPQGGYTEIREAGPPRGAIRRPPPVMRGAPLSWTARVCSLP